jgi:stage V sporulation protein B
MFAQTINCILQGIGKIYIPAISFFIGMIFKLVINFFLVGNRNIGIIGAVIGNIICNLVVCVIGFFVLKRNVIFNIDIKNFFIKPILAIFIMSIFSMTAFNYFNGIFFEKMATILAISSAIIIYGILIIVMKICPFYDKIDLKFKKINIF